MDVPIACTLTAGESVDRAGEWRHALDRWIDDFDQVSDRLVRLRLDPSPESLLAVIDLARREKECCRFFDFSMEIEVGGYWLVVSVPPEATEILSALISPGPETFDRPRR